MNPRFRHIPVTLYRDKFNIILLKKSEWAVGITLHLITPLSSAYMNIPLNRKPFNITDWVPLRIRLSF